MKIPKHIEDKLVERAEHALGFIGCDAEIYAWLEENGIEVSKDDISGGACSIFEPYASIESIRECIKNKEE